MISLLLVDVWGKEKQAQRKRRARWENIHIFITECTLTPPHPPPPLLLDAMRSHFSTQPIRRWTDSFVMGNKIHSPSSCAFKDLAEAKMRLQHSELVTIFQCYCPFREIPFALLFPCHSSTGKHCPWKRKRGLQICKIDAWLIWIRQQEAYN